MLLLQQVCLRPASSVWGLDFVQERFRSTSPDRFESMFINAGGRETKEDIRVEETTGESLGSECSALAP